MILYWLTLGVVAAVVLVLVGYLVAIAVALERARRNVSALADTFEAVAEHTEPLAGKVGAVGRALASARGDFEAVDRHLGHAVEAFERTPARHEP